MTPHSYMLLSKFCSSDWKPKTSYPSRDGQVAMQFNLRVTILTTKPHSLRHFCSMPTPTPHRHTTSTHSAIHAPMPPDWFWFSTSTDVSSCHKDVVSCCSQTARPAPAGLLLVPRLLWHLFILLFHFIPHWYVSQVSVFSSLNRILAAVANKLSRQSRQNDYNLDLYFIRFP